MVKERRYVCVFWLACFLQFYCCKARPTAKDDHVTMSGEPTHFQVDDKAAELEINVNAMGVKVNAKPASLQVVSKPGVPSVPIAHPAVVVPQLPPPYFQAPYYPMPFPGIIGHRRTVRKRHHFFNTVPGVGNWNYKKDRVPTKKNGNKMSKKSEIASKKRQWIQRLPVTSQLVPYPQMTNLRVHPLVQQMIVLSQGAMRQSIPRLPFFQTAQPRLQPMNTYGQGLPYMPLTSNLEENGRARSLVNREVFVPPYSNQQIYTPPPTTPAFSPMINQAIPYPTIAQPPLAAYNGYYDPIITRDFVPGFGTPGMMPLIQAPIPRAFVPNGMPGMSYPGYTPLGRWQRASKRLTIPREPTKNTPLKKISVQGAEKKTRGNNPRRKDLPVTIRHRRFIQKSKTSAKHAQNDISNKENVAKRQFIVTQPAIPQATQFVTYVPVVPRPQIPFPVQVVPNPQVQAMSLPTVAERKNLVWNLPSKTTGTFVLNLPSSPRVPQMFRGIPSDPVAGIVSNRPVVNTGVLTNQQNTMGLRRSGMVMQVPQTPQGTPIGELAGIQGQPVIQNNHHLTMLYNNEQWPTQVENQLFGGPSLQGRAEIPRRHKRRFRHWGNELEQENEYPEDSDYQSSSYADESPSSSNIGDDESTSLSERVDDESPSSSNRGDDESPSASERVDDEGSHTERILPDGRTVLKKDQFGFGPITVQAKTAEAASRDQDDVTDMDLDSDKRKKIARPSQERSYLDKRLGIPKPEGKE